MAYKISSPSACKLAASKRVLIGIMVIGSQLGCEEKEEPAAKQAEPVVTQEDVPAVENAPPPPPPPLETAIATTAPKADKAPKSMGKKPSARSDCAGTCSGSVDSAFRSALRQKAGTARSCYNSALRQNSGLQGKMTVAVRVSQSGRACSARAVNNTLGDGSVTACILAKFRVGSYPKPKGGCVDAQVPLNFLPKP